MQWNRNKLSGRDGVELPDVIALAMLLAAFTGMIYVAGHWTDPLRGLPPIDLSLFSLPRATFLSVSRVVLAYILSLVFAISVGYWAAHSRTAERLIIPMIDILQSIPVLGFLPGVVLFLVSLFPSTRIGLELSAVLMIFTGMVWNMTLSLYGSIKSIPREYRELMDSYQYSPLGRLLRLELPFSINGLVWNSMLSVAGGWFFLTICESFTLGDSSYQLIGLGSYMALAAERGDVTAIIAGILVMITLLAVTDRLVWKPLLNWAERFQGAPAEHLEEEQRDVINFFASSKRITRFVRRLRRYYSNYFFRPAPPPAIVRRKMRYWYLAGHGLNLVLAALCIAGIWQMTNMLAGIRPAEWWKILTDAGWSFLRVFAVLALCAVTMVPAALWLGSRPRIVRRYQTVIQVAAAFPAPMIFPVITSFFLWLSVPISVGSVVLMMMGAQWYVFFNVIAGVSNVSRDYVDIARISGMSYMQTLRRVHLPAAMPQMVTGFLTAAGGAWNTSIVAEIVIFRGKEYVAPGLGSYIAKAAAMGRFPELVAAVAVMVILIILVNRFVWAKLYNIAESRYSL